MGAFTVVPESITYKCIMLMHDAKERLGFVIRSSGYKSSQDKQRYLAESLAMTYSKVVGIETATRGQSSNSRWLTERKHRLTASTFELILDAVERDLYPPSLFDTLLGR